ncbi:MAG: efflux RND transporter periplasmic adaptor subunit [Thermoanaerobaculia bacterium]
MPARPRRAFRLALLLTAVATASATAAAHAVAVEARLGAAPASAAELKSMVSLEVRALPAALNQPVAKGAMLVEMDLAKLQKELEGEQKTLVSAQEEKRRLAVQRGATSSSPASNSRVDMRNAQDVSDAQMAESNAVSDIARLQSELSTADLRAPADGYVLRQLFAVGAKAKKRKPLAVFVEANKTVLEASVPVAEAGPFTVGAAVRVVDAGNAARGFRGKVLSVEPTGDSVALRIQPLELPFLALDAAASVSLSAAP